MIIAVIGSGGKTSLIHKAAREYLKLGKTVLVTTTTHMYRETDTLINPKKEEVQHVLREKGYCMAGGLVQELVLVLQQQKLLMQSQDSQRLKAKSVRT